MTLPTKATHLKRASLAALSLSFIVIISTPSTRLVSAYQRRPQTQEPLEVHQPPRQPLTCNPEHCDSIVNKCKLTDRCFCEGLKDARCRKDCIDCLEEKFGKCCDCVGLCPRHSNQVHASHVGYMTKNQTDQIVFELLTNTPDIHKRWLTLINPESDHIVQHPLTGNEIEFAYRKSNENNLIDISHDESLDKMDCIVAAISRQLSMSKCRSYCISMGSSSFRWFYEGCCHCVGQYCLNYGVKEPRCSIDY